MKKYILLAALFLGSFVCNANTYTEWIKEKKDLETEKSKMESDLASGGRWVTKSPWYNVRLKKNYEEVCQKLKEVKNNISDFEKRVTVTITKIELNDVPDLDVGRNNADLRVFFRSRGIEDSFIVRDNIGSYFVQTLSVKLEKEGVIEFKDYDKLSNNEDMDQISCDEIFMHALKNDSRDGCFTKRMNTEKGGYTLRLYYHRNE